MDSYLVNCLMRYVMGSVVLTRLGMLVRYFVLPTVGKSGVV